jgi:hypothetical protein
MVEAIVLAAHSRTSTPSTISIAERSYLRPSEAGTDYSTVWITSNPSNSGCPR